MSKAYVWCPAYPLADEAAFALCRQRTTALCARLGWKPVEAPSLSLRLPQGCWDGRQRRRDELAIALAHPVLIAARGGYGCVELVEDLLDYRKTPGLLIGFSDLTILHAIWRVRGWGETLYGFLPAVAGGARSLDSTAALAQGEGLVCDAASDPAVSALHPGDAQAPLFAACLRVLAGLVGTPAMPDLSGTILCLEDIDERPYQIDRDLQQLAAAGALDGLAGLIFGTLPIPAVAGYAGPTSRDIAATWAARLGIPCIAGLPFGHEPDPLTLPCGRKAELRVNARGWTLTVRSR